MSISSTFNDLELVGAVVIWVVTIARIGMTRQADSRLLWFALLTLAIGQSLQVEAVYHRVEQATGVVGGAAVVKHGFALLAAASTAAVVQALRPGSAERLRQGRPWIWLVPAILVLIAPWLLSPPRQLAPALTGRAEWYDTTWRSPLHWAAFLAYLGWALWGAARISWKFRKVETDGPTRTAVTLVGIGTTVGLGYIVEKAITVGAWLSGNGPAFTVFDQVAEACVLAASVSLIAIGTGYEAAWNRLHARTARRQLTVTTARLEPMADRLRHEFPAIEAPIALELDERLVGEVAWVHEGLRQLTAFLPPPAQTQGVGGDGALCDQAAWLNRALTIKASGRRPRFTLTTAPVADDGPSTDTALYLIALWEHTERIGQTLSASHAT